jgi:membrane-associated phospholipid phosphatase
LGSLVTDDTVEAAPAGHHPRRAGPLPQPVTCCALAALSAVAVAVTCWMALQPGAAETQTGFVQWVNDPPQPLAAVLAMTNVLLRPVALAVLVSALVFWIMATARGAARWEVTRAMVIAFALCELLTQVLKRAADQPRPTASIPGLDVHGYPKDPYGNAYPSAHTSVAVGMVAALWPWLTWPQRVAGVAVATLVGLNRLYIGAHWPIDVLGGAAIGILSASVCWLVATRWPIRRQVPKRPGPRSP